MLVLVLMLMPISVMFLPIHYILCRSMFTDQNLWPTFIGFNADNSKDKSGLFPILVWPEQRR
jgi:hypothetical protein